jgi:hypothetical protein
MDDEPPHPVELWRDAVLASELAERLVRVAAAAFERSKPRASASDAIGRMAESVARSAETMAERCEPAVPLAGEVGAAREERLPPADRQSPGRLAFRERHRGGAATLSTR